MSEFDDLLNRAFPAEAPSDQLQSRIADLSVRRAKRSLRPLWLGAIGVTGLAVALVVIAPRSASAAGLLEQATRGIVGEVTTYRIDGNGKRILIAKGWFGPREYRRETEEGFGKYVVVSSQRRNFAFSWAPHVGMFSWIDPLEAPVDPSLNQTLDPSGLTEIAKTLHAPPSQEMNEVSFEGRPAKRIQFRLKQGTLTLYGDPKSLRLIGYETDFGVPGNRGRYLTLLNPGRGGDSLDTSIEFGGRRIDVLKERARIEEAWATPIATHPVKSGTISLHHVEMTRTGELFVLYTGVNGKYGENTYPVQIRDDMGGTYAKAIGFRPYRSDARAGWPGFRFDGKPLEGAWFIRLEKGNPRTVSIGFRKEFEPVKQIDFRLQVPLNEQRVEVPTFLPFMSMAPASASSIRISRAQALGSFYMARKQWPQAERWLREYLKLWKAQGGRYAATGNAWPHIELARSLAEQGKSAEAKRMLTEARRRWMPGEGQMAMEEIEKLERRLAR